MACGGVGEGQSTPGTLRVENTRSFLILRHPVSPSYCFFSRAFFQHPFLWLGDKRTNGGFSNAPTPSHQRQTKTLKGNKHAQTRSPAQSSQPRPAGG